MWETRPACAVDAFDAIRGRGTVLPRWLLLLFLSMLIGCVDRRVPTARHGPGVGDDSTSMRSVIVVLSVARYCFPGTNVYMVPIVYLSLMVPTNLLFHLAFAGWHKWRPATTA